MLMPVTSLRFLEKIVMPESNMEGKAPPPLAGQVAALLGSLAVMAGLMYYSWTYPFPNGPLSVGEFIMLWFRELIIFMFAALVAFICLVGWCIRLIQHVRAGDRNAAVTTCPSEPVP